MRIYLLHKNGKILETADAGYGFKFNKKEIQLNHPNKQLMEITEKDYKKLDGKLEYFKIINKKIVEKFTKEKQSIDKTKQKWKKYNTMEGLKKRVKKLETNFSKLK